MAERRRDNRMSEMTRTCGGFTPPRCYINRMMIATPYGDTGDAARVTTRDDDIIWFAITMSGDDLLLLRDITRDAAITPLHSYQMAR